MNGSDLVRRLFEGYERAGVDGALEALADAAVLVVGPETSAEPDIYRGAEGARRYFAAFDGALEDVRFDLSAIHHDSPAAVIATVTLSGVGAATRIPVEQDVVMSFAAREGAITRIRSHPTLAAARVELGLTPE